MSAHPGWAQFEIEWKKKQGEAGDAAKPKPANIENKEEILKYLTVSEKFLEKGEFTKVAECCKKVYAILKK
ncbi:hypothetical protein ADUPG1_000093 [Aduncisulcus paluster]|uniref:Uncharacterized protein n=1 Tax=Aduncisulcus paluster TaxID=2918883 RepID=A0ABQ5K4U2_9EUKA|nr:hypothetical protein ADUPG1_000093 [Aduncisulcus paluster]